MDLVAPEIIEAIARVSGQAVESGKYPDRNWELGMEWMRQYGSALRHLLEWAKGEDIDPESGLSHLEHALWRLGALVTYEKRRVGTDDRPRKLGPELRDAVERARKMLRKHPRHEANEALDAYIARREAEQLQDEGR